MLARPSLRGCVRYSSAANAKLCLLQSLSVRPARGVAFTAPTISSQSFATNRRHSATSQVSQEPVQRHGAPEQQPSPTASEKRQRSAAQQFENLGLSAALSRQLLDTHPFISRPTDAQSKLIPSVLSPNDVVLRAHTGSGKSFGLLLALMAKPRIVFRPETGPQDGDSNAKPATRNGIASLILVPSNELASQYVEWTKSLLPPAMRENHHSVIQSLVRGATDSTPDAQMDRLVAKPPHILVATPRRALEILATPGGASMLGLATLRTVVLDEVDALLDLPGRFPHQKVIWKNLQHPPPGLRLLNEIMKVRATYSSGPPLNSQGQEGVAPRSRTRQERTSYHVKQHLMKKSPNFSWLARPRQREDLRSGEWPLQLVACSASANAVLRSFLGAKTGWVRLNVRAPKSDPARVVAFGRGRDGAGQVPLTGTWIDLTGLSGQSVLAGTSSHASQARADDYEAMAQSVMPKELSHACVVLDEGPPGSMGTPMRSLSSRRLRHAISVSNYESLADGDWMTDKLVDSPSPVKKARSSDTVVPSWSLPSNEIDVPMLEALAYLFATQGVERGIAFIPPQWSLKAVHAELSAYGVPVLSLEEMRSGQSVAASATGGNTTAGICVLQATSARGLDIPQLDHVFLLGLEAVGDTVRYTHLAGRASRLSLHEESSAEEQSRAAGRVVTLVRGLKAEHQLQAEVDTVSAKDVGAEQSACVANSELRMANLYKRLGIRPHSVALQQSASSAEVEQRVMESVPDQRLIEATA
ncbi:unnamed protein product [Parajaminaea phylloscopi]